MELHTGYVNEHALERSILLYKYHVLTNCATGAP